MSQFPDPISLPDCVNRSRRKRRRSVLRAAWWGVFLRLFIFVFEIYGFVLFDSASLLLDALGSAMDMVFSLVLILFIRLAAKPPDKEHPFGHGRYEPLAGLQLGIFLVLMGAGLFVLQGYSLFHHETAGPISRYAWLFALVPTLLFEICYHLLNRIAKREHSSALSAEAKHYRIDALTSLFALAALGAGALEPSWSLQLDHFGALLIASVMVIVGIFAARENVHQLMDRAPHSDYFARVERAAMRVDGVLETEKVRIQLYGPDAHVDIDIEVSPDLPVEEAHRISQWVRAEIQKEWSAVRDVTVHIEPFFPGDHE